MAQQPPTARPVSLYTWNCQGNFTTEEKGEVVNGMMGGSGLSLLFIQEGGVNLEGDYKGYIAVAGIAVGAFNERCTNYILFNDAWPRRMQSKVLTTANGSALIGGGIAGRTPAAVEIDRTLFISWHSLSGPNNLDTAELIRTIQTAPAYGKDYDLIIIGGDFNTSPGDVEAIIVGIARVQTNFYAKVVCCGQATLKKWDADVDFFVIFRKAHQQENGAVLVPVKPSDHNAVGTQLLLTV